MGVSSGFGRFDPKGDRRQTILSGPRDGNNNPFCGFSVFGLTLSFNLSTTPLVVSFAAGFGPSGAIEYTESISALSSLTIAANSTRFIFVERSATTGLVTVGQSAFRPIYQHGGSNPTASGSTQGWFDTGRMQMRNWSGSSWDLVQRVYIGEVVTDASLIVSTISYAYNGLYVSPVTAIAANTQINFNHNLGVPVSFCDVCLHGRESNDPYLFNKQPDVFFLTSGSEIEYGHRGWANTPNQYSILPGANPILASGLGFTTSGFGQLRVARAF